MNLSRLLTKAYDDALSKYDVLVMPTTLTTAEPLPTKDMSITGKNIIEMVQILQH